MPFGDKDKAEAMVEIHGLMKAWSPKEISDMDGLKAVFEDGWILLRPSGTEPKLKVVVEGESEARANELMGMATAVTDKVLG